MKAWVDKLPPHIKESFVNRPLFGHYLVEGSGEGSVTIVIKKSNLLWLARLLVYGELDRFVVDRRGSIVNYNKNEIAHRFLHGVLRYQSRITCWTKYYQRPEDYYDSQWLKQGTSKHHLKLDPELDYFVSAYYWQFSLEQGMAKRVYSDHYIDTREIEAKYKEKFNLEYE